ncbi:MAG: restriction endonuclease subunit S, partial [Acetatifactor sp.]|nr:restriction endonuclease subunit S [Acetatifactor sp.]
TPVYNVCTALGDYNNYYYAYILREMAKRGFIQSLYRGIRERSSDFRYDVFGDQFLPVPSRKEQDQIVQFLDWKVSGINSLISNYRRQIAMIDEMKQRAIDEAVIKGLRKDILIHNEDIRWDIDYPKHWTLQRIRESFTFRKGLSITKANLEDTGIAVISYGQVHSKKNTGVGLNEDLIRFVNESYLVTNKSCLVEKGDFIFADTSEDVSGSGNCAYVDSDDTIFAGYHTIIAHPDGSTNNKYLAYLFKSPTWRYQVRKKVNGVKVYSITQRILKDTFILVPPAEEQQEIVDYLDKFCSRMDAAVKHMEEEITYLQEMKVRLVADTVTGKIDVRDIEIPEYESIKDEDEIDSDIDAELDGADEQEG